MPTKIFSVMLSIFMLIFTSFFPGFVMPGTTIVQTGKFLEQVNEAFEFEADDSNKPVLGVKPGDEYYEAVATAAKAGLLEDYSSIDVYDSVKPEFVATVLVTAAEIDYSQSSAKIENASKIKNLAKVSAAVENGIISLNALGNIDVSAMDKKDVNAAIEKALELRPEKVEEPTEIVQPA